ncbi:TetR/AcrR family transcriptional regulator [Ktedonosporobacter rubrisoli]|uniref:TetR/AcrR family transcriptional regulator n=1 Tax=Ktedonosporobacter rubrisoli TaxID=2509675 RepID=A0A4P6JW91_KTERU|nr:TetR/AcrR family transcriptional regulator [Ktedonosporobacter rubrisoli]QBD79745.1 TetR/AcrR family transcriptional regulator [Ktedonosporobacter rubrisoli]
MLLTKDDWIRAGLRVLAESGIEHVKVENLAKMLQISKGSFYHYWKNRAVFLQALLAYWAEYGTAATIAELEKKPDPAERLERLIEQSFARNQSLEASVHQWARHDPAVRREVAQVEERRIHYIAYLLEESGYPVAKAQEMARVFYLLYLGWIDLSQRDNSEESHRLALKSARSVLNLLAGS